MAPGSALVVDFAFAITAFSLAAAWYLWPVLTRVPLKVALPPLLLLHLFRPVSLWLLVPGVVVTERIPPGFAAGTAYGDIVAAVLALVAAVMTRVQARGWRIAAWVFNLWGAIDAVKNCVVGMQQGSPAEMGVGVLVTAFCVPALLVSHALVFLLLLRKTSELRA